MYNKGGGIMKFEDITKNINKKLGKENSSLIADDMASLISYNASVQKDIQDKNSQIDKLKSDKEMLIEANGNLLQQISSETEDILKPKKEEKEEKKDFNFYSMYDEKGNFKKKLS